MDLDAYVTLPRTYMHALIYARVGKEGRVWEIAIPSHGFFEAVEAVNVF